jgi:hypothetical protein
VRLADTGKNLVSVHVRHADVEQNQVKGPLSDQSKRGEAPISFHRIEAMPLKTPAEQGATVSDVIDDEQAGLFHSGPSGRSRNRRHSWLRLLQRRAGKSRIAG